MKGQCKTITCRFLDFALRASLEMTEGRASLEMTGGGASLEMTAEPGGRQGAADIISQQSHR